MNRWVVLTVGVACTSAAIPPDGLECDRDVGCVGPGGCPAKRACMLGGRLGVCQCEAVRCTTSCGSLGWIRSGGQCLAEERCNGCDDNLNGQIDEGLSCASNSFDTNSCTERLIPWNWESNKEVYMLDTRYGASVSSRVTLFGPSLAGTVSADFTINSVLGGVSGLHPSDLLWAIDRQNNNYTQVTSSRRETFRMLAGAQLGGWGWDFSSDRDATLGSGFRVSLLHVMCDGAGVSSVPPILEDGSQTYSILTGSGDTVFFSFDSTTDVTSIWIDGRGSPTLDADLFVSTNGLPTKQSTSSATPGSSEEFIQGNFQGQRVYIAVHSAAGYGVVKVRAATALPSMILATQKVGVDFFPDSTQLRKIEMVVRSGQRAFFGMTEGKAVVPSIKVTYGGCTCGSGCSVCIHADTGRAHTSGVSNVVHLYSDEWSGGLPTIRVGGLTLAHEWGHQLLHLDDEYEDHGTLANDEVCHADDRCRASAMDDQRVSPNLCTDGNHGALVRPASHFCTSCAAEWCPNKKDKSLCLSQCVGCNTCALNGDSGWRRLVLSGRARGGTVPVFDPDIATYIDFSFPFVLDL